MDSGKLKEALPYYEKVMEKIVFKVISANLVYYSSYTHVYVYALVYSYLFYICLTRFDNMKTCLLSTDLPISMYVEQKFNKLI
jgi:hypothetical protein